MPTPGLASTLRLPGQPQPTPTPGDDIIVEVADNDADTPEFDDKGAVIRIEHGDGSVTVSLDGSPLIAAPKSDTGGWFDNLVTEIDAMELSRISADLLRGVEDDIQSRKEWIEDRSLGVRLLGLKIEVPGLQGASDGAPVDGMSRVRHPLLLEAVLRFQANARSELLPTDGPVKIREDNNNATLGSDQLADALELDMNHYLTTVATEYYPDTDRMLLMLGFGGTAFKKVYFCPLRSRPVSETVDADDLIVNNAATDLTNAKRVTHRVYMRPSTVKRLQILGVYRDVELHQPLAPNLDSLQREEKAQQGIAPEAINPEDRDREIYECYCELDVKGFEHRTKGAPSGLEIPYRVTIDVSSREILSIVRNYNEDTKELPEPRQSIVKYTFVPGLGFYDIGLLHILGNTTNALTAAWREALDTGMYANFPGFLMADVGARQNTNIFRVPPGGGALVKTGGMPLADAIMALPYSTQHMPALLGLVGDMAQTGMRIGGTSEQQVGEGRADAPVGTTLAMIEQATKVLNAVHKRMHTSQAREFELLVECFREHPESFLRFEGSPEQGRSGRAWDEPMFMKAIHDFDLAPQADPNTASHGQRVMKVMALNLWAKENPSLADPIAISEATLQAMGWSNPQQFMLPRSAMGQPPPELQEAQAKIAIEQQDASSRAKEADAKVALAQAKLREGGPTQVDTPADMMAARAKLLDAMTGQRELELKHAELGIEDQNRDLDRQSRERMAALELARDVMEHPETAALAAREVKPIEREIGAAPVGGGGS